MHSGFSFVFDREPEDHMRLRHSFVSPCRREGPQSIVDTHGKSGTFLQIQMHLHELAPYPQELINGIRQLRSRSIHLQWRKVKGQNKIEI